MDDMEVYQTCNDKIAALKSVARVVENEIDNFEQKIEMQASFYEEKIIINAESLDDAAKA